MNYLSIDPWFGVFSTTNMRKTRPAYICIVFYNRVYNWYQWVRNYVSYWVRGKEIKYGKIFFSTNSFVELVVPFSQSNRLRDPIRHAQLNIQLLSMSVSGSVNRKISLDRYGFSFTIKLLICPGKVYNYLRAGYHNASKINRP